MYKNKDRGEEIQRKGEEERERRERGGMEDPFWYSQFLRKAILSFCSLHILIQVRYGPMGYRERELEIQLLI
jgi:hypothetical protein